MQHAAVHLPRSGTRAFPESQSREEQSGMAPQLRYENRRVFYIAHVSRACTYSFAFRVGITAPTQHTAPAQEEPAEDKEVARPASSGSQPPVAVAAKPKPAASAASRPTFLGSASLASASASSAASAAPKMNIDWKGDLAEQCRDAIKNGDSAAVALLLERGQVLHSSYAPRCCLPWICDLFFACALT